MLITTVLTFFVIPLQLELPACLVSGHDGFFPGGFRLWASNLLKLPDGGWFPLFIGGHLPADADLEGRATPAEREIAPDAIDLQSFEAVFVVRPCG